MEFENLHSVIGAMCFSSMNFEEINHLFESLRQSGFNFTPQTRSFNPLEEFADRTREKELAHSKVLKNLFNPKGSHGKQSIFLNEFLDYIRLNQLRRENGPDLSIVVSQNIEEVEISDEYCISEFTDGKDSGRIDIYIELKLKNQERSVGVIIENKLNNAGFQYKQLQRYRKAIANKLGSKGLVVVVCLPLLIADKEEYKDCDCIIYPNQLANIIESATKLVEMDSNINLIKAYTTYLRNLHSINTNMDNAKKLYKLLEDNNPKADGSSAKVKISDIPSLIEAYNSLPRFYLYEIKKKLEETISDDGINSKYTCKMDDSTKDYLDVWDEKIYRDKERWQWVSIAASIDSIWIYVVSNEKDDNSRRKKAKEINYGLEDKTGSLYWYKPIRTDNGKELEDDENFIISFKDELPDINSIVKKITNILERMDQKSR